MYIKNFSIVTKKTYSTSRDSDLDMADSGEGNPEMADSEEADSDKENSKDEDEEMYDSEDFDSESENEEFVDPLDGSDLDRTRDIAKYCKNSSEVEEYFKVKEESIRKSYRADSNSGAAEGLPASELSN